MFESRISLVHVEVSTLFGTTADVAAYPLKDSRITSFRKQLQFPCWLVSPEANTPLWKKRDIAYNKLTKFESAVQYSHGNGFRRVDTRITISANYHLCFLPTIPPHPLSFVASFISAICLSLINVF
jgi:hypothetical protein